MKQRIWRRLKGTSRKGISNAYDYSQHLYHIGTGWPVRMGIIHHSNGCPFWVDWLSHGIYDVHNLEIFPSNPLHLTSRHSDENRTKVIEENKHRLRDEKGRFLT